MTTPFHDRTEVRDSPFTGLDLCAAAGFELPPGTRRPVFDDDVWSFTEVIGMARYISPNARVLDFTAITDPRWRRLAKEYIAALLLPGHEAVAVLPQAHRFPRSVLTCRARLVGLTRFLTWLAARGISRLHEVTQHECDAYLLHTQYPSGGHDGAAAAVKTGMLAAQTMLELGMYSELFTDDRYQPGFRAFKGRAANKIAGYAPSRQNSTPPVPQDVLRPLLAAALYVANTIGPLVAGLEAQRRERQAEVERMTTAHRVDRRRMKAVLRRHVAEGRPLQRVGDNEVKRRLQEGWSAEDPLLTVSFSGLAQEIGFAQIAGGWWDELRAELEATAAAVGVSWPWGQGAAEIARADDHGLVAWTEPLSGRAVIGLANVASTAALLVIAIVSGMRFSELAELNVGCRSREEVRPGMVRHRLASKVVKGKPVGGLPDEWVVVAEAHDAAGIAELLAPDTALGAPLFGRFAFASRYESFKTWVNGPTGQRLGLEPIPDGVVTMRMLRRTLAIELAYRPGGLLAAKIALKHVSVATTEGYAARPGGAQAKLLAEVSEQEQDRNLELLLEEWRNYQDGVMPAGPGARELTEFFDGVDGQLAEFAKSAPKTAATDQELRNLLTRRAKVLHLGTGNYCWFSDPSRALCLKLAGTPTADKPLIGMCDSARCPQATHHPRHRPVWADAVEKNTVFLGNLGASRKTERRRLEVEVARAARIVAEIDATTNTTDDEEGAA
ncbi:hypothetical protein [Amycolatopsis sp. cmx-4-68]|uniref:hypothetical protein n=1 Tax=Amycolatopsis sp. cmx-4-68 TaxID=2790938 RepID=UPI00397941A8